MTVALPRTKGLTPPVRTAPPPKRPPRETPFTQFLPRGPAPLRIPVPASGSGPGSGSGCGTGTGPDPDQADAAALRKRITWSSAPEDAPPDPAGDLPALDPTARAAALLAPPSNVTVTTTSTDAIASARTAEVQALANALVEEAAFWGDGQKGIARLRFGRDARRGLAGATVTLASEGGAISLRLEGVDDATRAALTARLRAAGVTIDE